VVPVVYANTNRLLLDYKRANEGKRNVRFGQNDKIFGHKSKICGLIDPKNVLNFHRFASRDGINLFFHVRIPKNKFFFYVMGVIRHVKKVGHADIAGRGGMGPLRLSWRRWTIVGAKNPLRNHRKKSGGRIDFRKDGVVIVNVPQFVHIDAVHHDILGLFVVNSNVDEGVAICPEAVFQGFSALAFSGELHADGDGVEVTGGASWRSPELPDVGQRGSFVRQELHKIFERVVRDLVTVKAPAFRGLLVHFRPNVFLKLAVDQIYVRKN
jgi:hypothetical protein